MEVPIRVMKRSSRFLKKTKHVLSTSVTLSVRIGTEH